MAKQSKFLWAVLLIGPFRNNVEKWIQFPLLEKTKAFKKLRAFAAFTGTTWVQQIWSYILYKNFFSCLKEKLEIILSYIFAFIGWIIPNVFLVQFGVIEIKVPKCFVFKNNLSLIYC